MPVVARWSQPPPEGFRFAPPISHQAPRAPCSEPGRDSSPLSESAGATRGDPRRVHWGLIPLLGSRKFRISGRIAPRCSRPGLAFGAPRAREPLGNTECCRTYPCRRRFEIPLGRLTCIAVSRETCAADLDSRAPCSDGVSPLLVRTAARVPMQKLQPINVSPLLVRSPTGDAVRPTAERRGHPRAKSVSPETARERATAPRKGADTAGKVPELDRPDLGGRACLRKERGHPPPMRSNPAGAGRRSS